MYIEQLYTGCLAEAAYYVESNGEAVIIDPMRETEPYETLAAQRGAKIKYIFETHFHADFVSGHVDLARKTGARIVFGPTAQPNYDAHVATHGETFQIGDLTMVALHTPGHTMESASYLLRDAAGQDHAVFTGDTLFVGEVGRPDLAVPTTLTKEDLAGMLFDSLHGVIMPLADEVIVYPGHGAGSQCGKHIGKESYSTIGQQRQFNYALQVTDKDAFIRMATDISTPPAYFPENARINKEGYEDLDTVMARNAQPLTPAALEAAVANGATVLDTRTPDAFGAGHVPGSLNVGLDGQYAVWVGTLLTINQPLVLICEPDQAAEAVLRLARVGFESVVGYLEGGMATWQTAGREVARVHTVSAAEVPALLQTPGTEVLDVRRDAEAQTAHLKGARHISLAELSARMSELNPDTRYVLHCAGGYRSMIAASLLQARGYDNFVNVAGGFGALREVDGLEVIEGLCPTQLRMQQQAASA